MVGTLELNPGGLELPSAELWDEEVEGEGGGPVEDKLGRCYYKLGKIYGSREGWVITAKASTIEQANKKDKGWTCLLDKYGKFFLNPVTKQDSHKRTLPQWKEVDRPYDHILTQPGGVLEFPISQIVEMGWHRECFVFRYEYPTEDTWRRIRVRVTFPQLQGVNITDLKCPLCSQKAAHTDPDDAARLLNRHKIIVHKDAVQLETLREAVKGVQSGDQTAFTLLLQSQMQMITMLQTQINLLQQQLNIPVSPITSEPDEPPEVEEGEGAPLSPDRPEVNTPWRPLMTQAELEAQEDQESPEPERS